LEWERIQLFCVENLIWILILVTFVMFSASNPRFLEPTTIFSILQEAGMLGPLALGLGLCLIAGSFDVSLCRIAGLSLVITGWLCEFTDLPWFVIIPVPIVIGLTIGIFNGVLIGKLGLNSFLVTLAGYFMWDSLSRAIMMGRYFPPGRFDPRILVFGRGRIMDTVFVSTVIFTVLLLLIWFFMKYTKKGNAIYAVGASVDTARRLGINTKNTTLLVHAVAGALAGICGLFYVGYAVEIKPIVVPSFYIFHAFVAIAIAGISISGGRGRIINILGGATLIPMTAYGATMMGAGYEFAYYVVPGTLFLVVIILINRLDAFRDRILSGIYIRSYARSTPSSRQSESKEVYGSIPEKRQKKNIS